MKRKSLLPSGRFPRSEARRDCANLHPRFHDRDAIIGNLRAECRGRERNNRLYVRPETAKRKKGRLVHLNDKARAAVTSWLKMKEEKGERFRRFRASFHISEIQAFIKEVATGDV